ncbi:MAG TPA: histidine kinase [Novosphingobium sp.]|nr:histidine kinase [Novosphingobium sp.]
MQSRQKLRPGLIVAVFRIVLALALLATSVLSPDYPIVRGDLPFLGLTVYLGLALALLGVALSHWWFEHHLRTPAFAIDALAAFLLLYWVEGGDEAFVSPFMAFHAYLMITATLIWRWRGTAIVLALIVAAYLTLGLVMHGADGLVAESIHLRRLVFMLTIGALIIWYGLQRARHLPGRLDWPLDATIKERVEAIARFVQQHVPCTGLAMAWMPDDEPWTHIGTYGDLGGDLVRLPPGIFPWSTGEPDGPILFDRPRNRSLLLTPRDRVVALRRLPACPLAYYLAVQGGIVVPIQSHTGRGSLMVSGVRGVSGDHLRPMRDVAAEIGYALDRHEMASLIRNAESTRIRMAVARDLHDGVAQSLAGAQFRLEALRRAAETGRDIVADLAAIQQSLAREEMVVEQLIAKLRGGEDGGLAGDAAGHVARTLDQTADHWGIAARFEQSGTIDPLSRLLVLEIQQVVREAVANAVRHGGANEVRLVLARDNGKLQLDLIDNGRGVGSDRADVVPLSIRDRAEGLGGTFAFSSRAGETRLSMTLPVGDQP